MAFISKFCFSCSVRLGATVTAVLTLIQGAIFFGMTFSYMDSLAAVTDGLHGLFNTLNMEGEIFTEIAEKPKILIITLSTFFSCLIWSCVLLLYGCYQCKTWFMYPFTIFYLVYIIELAAVLLIAIFYIKMKGNGLGDLILYSNLGGFVLLFYLYTWSCVISLIQIINELRTRLKQKLKVVHHMLKLPNKIIMKSKNKTKGFHNHDSHFN